MNESDLSCDPPKVEPQQAGGGGSGSIIIPIMWIICSIIALIIAWMANYYEAIGMRIFYTISAFVGGPFYLVYYLILRLGLGYEFAPYRKIVDAIAIGHLPVK